MNCLRDVLGIDIIFICLDGLLLNYEDFYFSIILPFAKTMVVLVVIGINAQLLCSVLNSRSSHSDLMSLSLRV